MRLKLIRTAKKETYTIGKMYVNGVYFCDTLEDKRRDLSIEEKVAGETAIPEGKYTVVITKSKRFGVDMPLLLNVPSFEGIRIHKGNTDIDTHGCILVGYNKEVGKLLDSTKAYNELFEKMKVCRMKNEEIVIEVL